MTISNEKRAAKPSSDKPEGTKQNAPRTNSGGAAAGQANRNQPRGQNRNAKKPPVDNREKKAVANTGEEKPKQNRPQRRYNNGKKPQKTGGINNNIAVNIIPLGGMGEIGKNMTAYECQGEIIIVDCGVAFPDSEMLGVDLVIPDFSYVQRNFDKVKALFVTHGHEDHIGGIPYFLKTVNVPVYTAKLTAAFIEGKLEEHGILKKSTINVIKAGQVTKIGPFSVEAIPVNHSIPDAFAFSITTPAGVFVQTGDFKVDHTPIQGESINLARFGEIGSKGVMALLCDSTNAERPGYTMSERKVGESIHRLVESGTGKRIIVATFASNLHRVQEIVDASVAAGRKVAFSGRSMENNVGRAVELGYLRIPKGTLIEVNQVNNQPFDKVTLVTTGSQGENMAALSRMATGDHRQIKISDKDLIILSSSPIPGNEKMVNRVVNNLMKLGADVIYEAMYDIHVSGHAFQDEIKLMIGLTKPKYYVPVHGEYKHLRKGAKLAMDMRIPESNIVFLENGSVLRFLNGKMITGDTVPAGDVMVDGLGVGDVGSVVLRDRKHLAEDGIVMVCASISGTTGTLLCEPEIISRGFVYVKEAEELMGEIKAVVRRTIDASDIQQGKDIGIARNKVRDAVSDLLWQKTKRSPIVLPVILEVKK